MKEAENSRDRWRCESLLLRSRLPGEAKKLASAWHDAVAAIILPEGRPGQSYEGMTARVRIRLDALREKNWRFRPYLVGAVVFSNLDVTLDSVDGKNPPDRVTGDPPDYPLVDVSSFSDSQLGGLARFGLEYGLTGSVALDVSGTYEVIEFPSGTNTMSAGNAGVVIRL